MEIATQLREIVMQTEKCLETESVEQFLEGTLEIKRLQSYAGGKWETVGYELTTACGGPTVWIETYSNTIRASWYPEQASLVVNRKAIEKLREIEDYLDEVAP